MSPDLQMNTYARAPIKFVRGEGSYLFDDHGDRYLDLLCGIAVTSLGHCHPQVVAAINEQAAKLDHVSNLYQTEPQEQLAARLTEKAGFDARVFFANSGAEANECALKLARRVSAARHGTPRSKVVALTDSFHGRTFATLAATGQSSKHTPFQPLPGWFTHVHPDDPEALASSIDDDTGAVIIEVIQGEGGVRPISDEILLVARQRCDQTGAVLIFDEVQTGMGRLGEWFGFQTTPVTPDVFTVAKALANGLPIGACIAAAEVAEAFVPGDHASTFGGGPVVCAAALAVIDVIDSEQLLKNAREAGVQLAEGVAQLASRGSAAARTNDAKLAKGSSQMPGEEGRGRGLLQGLVLDAPIANAVVDQARTRGVIIGTAGANVVRFAPALNITAEQLDSGLAVVAEALEAAK